MNINIRKTYRTFETGGSNPPAEIQAKINASAAKWGVEPDQLNVQKVGDEWVWSYANKTERFKPIGTKTFDRAAEKVTVEKCGEQYAQLAKYVEDEELRNNDIQQGIIQQGRVNGVLSVWYPQFPDCPKEIREKIVEEEAYEDRASLPEKNIEGDPVTRQFFIQVQTTKKKAYRSAGVTQDVDTSLSYGFTAMIPYPEADINDMTIQKRKAATVEGGGEDQMSRLNDQNKTNYISLTLEPECAYDQNCVLAEAKDSMYNALRSSDVKSVYAGHSESSSQRTNQPKSIQELKAAGLSDTDVFKKGGFLKKYKKKKGKAKLGSKISFSELKNEDKFKKEGFEYKKQGGKLSFKTNYRNLVK